MTLELKSRIAKTDIKTMTRPKLYSINIMINTSYSDEEIQLAVDNFIASISHTDSCHNIMFVDPEVLNQNNRRASL